MCCSFLSSLITDDFSSGYAWNNRNNCTVFMNNSNLITLIFFSSPELFVMLRGNVQKKNQVYLKTLSKLRLTPLPPILFFWQIYFWQSVDHVDLPASPSILDKNHEILGFETYILYYP